MILGFDTLEKLRLVMHSDAAFQNAQGGASQAGYIISVTDDRLAKGELAPWSPLIWRSHKMRRVVGSTLAAETQSLLNAAAMLRCPARSDYLVSLENGSESNRRRATFVPQDPAFGAIVEQITTGGTCLLDRWPEWQSTFAEFMVREFGANEKTLEDIDVKAAPNSNRTFSKSDVNTSITIQP